jgi:hypothetical protein
MIQEAKQLGENNGRLHESTVGYQHHLLPQLDYVDMDAHCF